MAVRHATVALAGASHQGAAPAQPVERFAAGAATRNLTDQVGDAWFGVGDTAWSLTIQLSPAEVTSYLEDRAGRGTNLVLVNLIDHAFGVNAPNNYNNDPPFTGTAFQSSLNESYWTVVDHAVAECERLGITMLACPAYLGFAGTEEGWDTEVAAASNAQMTTYGQALTARYGSSPNVLWLIGHDQVPSATEKAREEAMAAEFPSSQLVGLGAFTGADILGSPPWGTTTIAPDFETVYSYNETPVGDGLAAWGASPTRPWMWFEGIYENEQSVTDLVLRYQMWGAFVAGATAVLFGNSPIWKFDTGWESALSDNGSDYLGVFADRVSAMGSGWAATAADPAGAFLTAGASSGGDRAGARFGSALGVVYMPSARSVTLDLSEISAGSQARVTRVDPTSGATSVLGTYALGSQAVGSQGNNASGDDDWVLIVEAV